MPLVRVNGFDLFYDQSGAGEPLLLIAGFACDHSCWHSASAVLARHHRVIRFDNRGTGRGGGDVFELSIERRAADAVALLDVFENPHPTTLEAIYRQSRAISAFDGRDRRATIRCPTLVLAGSEDLLMPLAHARQLGNAIANAELVVLDRIGHGMLIESPERAAREIEQFSRRNTNRAM